MRFPERGTCETLERRTLLATFPPGFEEQQIVFGLSFPTSMDVANDGRIFLAEQGGSVRVIENGQMLQTPFVTVPVSDVSERGLSGVELDPNFEFNGYVYVYYTHYVPGEAPHNRLSRFTANGNVAVPGTELVLIDIEPAQSTIHNGGAIHFGLDGKLYLGVGDDANSANAQSLTSLKGKVLRLNPDGSIPTDNPFYGQTSGPRRAIWAMGLRNPFTFDIHPTTGVMYINDVGQAAWEEINVGAPGANYGWPIHEGPSNDPNFTAPIYAYQHSEGCAITGGAFYHPQNPQFPAEFLDQYFFADFCGQWMRAFDGQSISVMPFASDVLLPPDIDIDDSGNLYYLRRGYFSDGSLYRVSYTGNLAPAISEQPADALVAVGETAMFSVVAVGSAPLNYQWQRNETDIPGATSASYTTPPLTLANDGATYRVIITNTSGATTSDAANLHVVTGSRPVALIASPAPGTLYAGGQLFSFSGFAIDAEDGMLNPTSLTWRVDFHHDGRVRPFMRSTSGIAVGTFTIPIVGETDDDVFYRIHLTARDSSGLTRTVTRDLLPITFNITIDANFPGLQLRLDGQPIVAPFTFMGVAGIQRTLEAVSPQSIGAAFFEFLGWSDGGAINHTILTPNHSATITAKFRQAPFAFASDLPWTAPMNAVGPVERDTNNGGAPAGDGGVITLNTTTYSKGFGAWAESEILVPLGGNYVRFLCDVGVDDAVGSFGTVVFEVWAEGSMLYTSGPVGGVSAPRRIDFDVTGRQQLRLVVHDAGDGNNNDMADWANPILIAAPHVITEQFYFATAPHRLSFAFNASVGASLHPADLLVENLTTGQTIPSNNFGVVWLEPTRTAHFIYNAGALPDGRYRATLLAAGITDSAAHHPPRDHTFDFLFLRGDANHDGAVNINDFTILAANFGQSQRDFTQGDFNYDGRVNISDFTIFASRFGTALSPAAIFPRVGALLDELRDDLLA